MSKRIAQSGLASPVWIDGRPALFTRGEGHSVVDETGRSYVDFILGYGSVVLGHAVPAFISQIASQGDLGTMLPGYTALHEQILDIFSPPQAQGAFFKTGSEAVTAAIRIGSWATGRLGVIRCGFLGWHDALLGRSPRWHEPPSSPLRAGLRYNGPFRGISGDEAVWNWESLDIDELRCQLQANSGHYGSLVIDTYQSRYMQPGVLRQCVALAKKSGLIVVADETKIAGRVNSFGFFRQMSLEADLTVVGKAIANGYPLSILSGAEPLMRYVEETRITGTFAQELPSVVAALATHSVMKSRDGYSTLARIGVDVAAAINEGLSSSRVKDVVRCAPVFGGAMVELEFDPTVLGNLPRRKLLTDVLAQEGILILQGHPSYVSLSHATVDHAALSQAVMIACNKWADASNNDQPRRSGDHE